MSRKINKREINKRERLFLVHLDRVLYHHDHFNRIFTNTMLVSIMFLLIVITAVLKGAPLNIGIFVFAVYAIVIIIFLILMAKKCNHDIIKEIPELGHKHIENFPKDL